MSEWNPSGAVLVVGHALPGEVLADVRRRCADTTVTVLDLATPDRPEAIEPEAADPDSEFPPESDRAVATISQLVAEQPDVSTVLALSRWAARDVWRVVRPRPELRGFTHLDNLERARRQRLAIDVSPHGRRRSSHRFALEFGGDEIAWDPWARVRVLVGPRNAHGRAAGWARALRTLMGVDAISLAVGDDGFPAELMATTADWETKSVRRQVGALAATATHLLVDDGGPMAAELCGGDSTRVVAANGQALPEAIAPGDPPDRAKTPMQVVIVSGEPTDVPTTWRIARLADLPPSQWVPAVRHADLVVDHRDPPLLDALTLNGMATGGVVVAELPERGAFRKPVPHLRSVTDPLRIGESGMQRLRAESVAYVAHKHGDTEVAYALKRVLRFR